MKTSPAIPALIAAALALVPIPSAVLPVRAQAGSAVLQAPPPPGEPRNFRLPEKREITLDNGMAVTLVPFGDLPKVTANLVLRVGALNEGPEEVWLSQLTGDLLKEGTTSAGAEEVARRVAAMGGELSVSTGADQTTVLGDVLSEFAPDLVELMAEVVRRPALPESEIERLKNNLARQLSIARSQPQALARERFLAELYPDHPYGRVFPSEERLRGYTVEQAREFYRANFGAARAHLYLAGRFDPDSVEAAVRRAFGDWETGPEPLKNPPRPESARLAAVHIVDRPGAVQSTVYLGLPVVDPSHPDYMPLVVTNALLGGSFISRITTNIREDKGYTYSPGSSISTRYRAGHWLQVANVTTAVTGAALREIFYEIRRLAEEPPPPEELERIRNYVAGGFVISNSSRGGVIGFLAFMDLHGLEDDFLTHYVENVHRVTPEQVREMARRYLVPEKMLLVIAGDEGQVREQIEEQLGDQPLFTSSASSSRAPAAGAAGSKGS